jgi:DNA polymerase III epsilon subunit family exonuclease
VTGVAAHPSSTLLDRTLAFLADGSQAAPVLAREIFGLRNASDSVAARLTTALIGADPRVRQLPDGTWSLVPAGMGSPLLEDCPFAVVDVETTGGNRHRNDRVTEIAVVVVQGERIEVVLDTLINPEQPIAPMITSITNITNAMVRDAPTFAEVADDVLGALAGRVFVAHNARFDWGMVSRELRRTRAMDLSGPQLCTVRLSRRLIGGLESYSLDNVAHYLGLDNQARHRAAGDALVTARVLHQLLPRAREHDVRTVRELEKFAVTPQKRRRRNGQRGQSHPPEPRDN